MTVAGYEFNLVGCIDPKRNADGTLRLNTPQSRYVNKRGSSLHRYGEGPFCNFSIKGLSHSPGVYALIRNNEIMYIGECEDLYKRINYQYGNISPKNCFEGGRQTNCRLNNLIYLDAVAGWNLELWFHKTENYKAIEAGLRRVLRPPWNKI